MGRFLKNTQIKAGSYAIQLPLGTNSLGPDAPVNGQVRFNESNSRVELFYNAQWNQIAKIGNVTITVDEFTGDGISQTDFTMSQAETDPNAILVHIGGVYQQPTTNYTVSGTTIHFTSVPPAPGVNPNKIVVVHNLNSTNAA